jgi:hypothetical protein
VIVILTELEAAHGPAVVYVTVYVFNVLDARFISPVDELAKTNPAGEDVNVPPDVPVIVGIGLAPDEQNVDPL